MTWPIGYVALDSAIEGWAPERAITVLAELGFGAVDWSFVQLDRLDQSPTVFRDLVSRTRDAGMQVPQLVTADDLITLDTQLWTQRVEHLIRAVEVSGAERLRAARRGGERLLIVPNHPTHSDPQILFEAERVRLVHTTAEGDDGILHRETSERCLTKLAKAAVGFLPQRNGETEIWYSRETQNASPQTP